MIITNDGARAERLRVIRGHGVSTRSYWHQVLGFNYRMSNICGAIGLAQIERIEATLARKRIIANHYRGLLSKLPVSLPTPIAGTTSSAWVISCLLPAGVDRDLVQRAMLYDGVETRPVFYCAHHMPMYRSNVHLPVSEDIAARGLSLPSYPGLTEDEISTVVRSLQRAIEASS